MISQSPAGGTELARGETRHDHRLDRTAAGGRAGRDRTERARRERPSCERPGSTPVTQERTVTDPTQDGVVVEQRPGSGTQVDEGREVVIVIGVLEVVEPPPTTTPEVP